jgi:hypothetical protein
MVDHPSKDPERDAVANVPAPAGDKNDRVAVPPGEIGSTEQIHVGDAKKVIEKYFRKRTVAASVAGRIDPATGQRYPVIYTLLLK